MPELRDLQGRIKSLSEFGDFSVIEFTMVGLGEPRQVRAGVVGGSYFKVMGLRPVLGRLLGPGDDGPNAAGAAVLTHRFWTSAFQADPSIVGKTVRFGDRSATIVGVLEPSVPYPTETEIIANVVTSPHHLDATMVDGRVHRMTELFGRLAPGRGPGARPRPSCRRRTAPSSRSTPRPIRRRPTSASTRSACAIRSSRRRARCCWCCWRPRA